MCGDEIIKRKLNDRDREKILKLCEGAEDIRLARAIESKRYYGNVCDKMHITAIVGTNGKTTSAHMLRHILQTAAGKEVGLIGTTGVFGTGTKSNFGENLTTPDPTDLHKIFFQMYNNGIREVVMEVSAHAIYYKKIAGIKFAAAILTNITQDHLDFFKTFEEYKNTKLSFFNDYDIDYKVVQPAKIPYKISLFGEFNKYNAGAVRLVALHYGINEKTIKKALQNMPDVAGRFNVFKKRGRIVVIDYAHTPDGLRNILKNARELSSGKLFCVFGCGGNRDKTKRPIMGEIGVKFADYCVITTDNPRDETEEDIIADITRNLTGNNFINIVNRSEAIKYAIGMANQGDIVVIAGKGHEEYMEVKGMRIPYSDFWVINEF
ncbi:MAG: UDP-N-acetylmuramoyl-L-alanyl-D-glutamate--2,6-diaminopimelate ligase [Christensenellaceae bacterium]|jgi:UDP-N-acetylmuramoyl-L-alanyl-D-glutamate--2,6-diaminopimelate ligase|nr:UDP-N-acetylmuramoyl-L-alanyl-D-glutamate--2,6-diaminopimelate ligase [Christensenellaceae bacterium]